MTSWPSSGKERVQLPGPWHPSPYLHLFDHAIMNPHENRGLGAEHPWYPVLKRLIEENAMIENLDEITRGLAADGWLIPTSVDLSHRYCVRYVSIEASSVCNQKCSFCPVSVNPRAPFFMATELFERIVDEIAALNQPIEAVAMNQYNEPTIDGRFIEQVRYLREAGLPVAVFSNGTGLSAETTDALVAIGGVRYLSINLSTLDREEYRAVRGKDQLLKVLANLDYAKDKPVAEEMVLTVLNEDREKLDRSLGEISRRFEGSRFVVRDWIVNNRAGNIDRGITGAQRNLGGCDYMGSRPIEHIHITAAARVVLCCQDYEEKWVAGSLEEQPLETILSGPEFARMRRMVYGLEKVPSGFLCSNCPYSLQRGRGVCR